MKKILWTMLWWLFQVLVHNNYPVWLYIFYFQRRRGWCWQTTSRCKFANSMIELSGNANEGVNCSSFIFPSLLPLHTISWFWKWSIVLKDAWQFGQVFDTCDAFVSCFSNQHLNLAVLGQSGHLYKLFSTLFLHICKSLFIFDRYCVALEHFLQTYWPFWILYFSVGFSWGWFLRCDSCILHLKDALHPMFLQVKYHFNSRRKLNGSIFTILWLLIITIAFNIKNMKSIFINNIIQSWLWRIATFHFY